MFKDAFPGMKLGACYQSGEDFDLNEPNEETKRLCDSCKVVDICKSHGINKERFGIWGGLSERQRVEIRKARGIPNPPIMGADLYLTILSTNEQTVKNRIAMKRRRGVRL